MSTTRRRRKSPQWLYGTSTHPTMVTHRSQSWSWIIDSHPFRSTSISPLIPQIRLIQTLTWRLQGQSHGWVQRSRSHSSPGIQQKHLLSVSYQSEQPFLRYVQYWVWSWKDTSEIFKENFAKKKSFRQNASNIESSDKHDQWNIATKCCSNTLRGCHFILQTSKFLFINVTAVTLC